MATTEKFTSINVNATSTVTESCDKEKPVVQFSDLSVSTMTCAGSFAKEPETATNNLVNIFAIAKYLPLDDVIIGIKLVYAAGESAILRGACKLSKKNKDFYNQVTFNLRLNEKSLLSYKLFHNGAIQLTGAHSKEEAAAGCNYLLNKLENFTNIISIQLAKIDNGLLVSHDHLVYTWDGCVLGYLHPKNGIYLCGEYVDQSSLDTDDGNYTVLVSKKWDNHTKAIYSMDGQFVGRKRLLFNTGIGKTIYRKQFEVKHDRIYYNNTIIGQQTIELEEFATSVLKECLTRRQKFINETGKIIQQFRAFKQRDLIKPSITVDDIKVHNINARFEGSFRIYRDILWQCLVNQGISAKYDSCGHLGVNIRYHHPLEMEVAKSERGKCPCPKNSKLTKKKCSNCKIVSMLCFVSGKIVITGLKSLEDAQDVISFIKDFYIDHYEEIRQK